MKKLLFFSTLLTSFTINAGGMVVYETRDAARADPNGFKRVIVEYNMSTDRYSVLKPQSERKGKSVHYVSIDNSDEQIYQHFNPFPNHESLLVRESAKTNSNVTYRKSISVFGYWTCLPVVNRTYEKLPNSTKQSCSHFRSGDSHQDKLEKNTFFDRELAFKSIQLTCNDDRYYSTEKTRIEKDGELYARYNKVSCNSHKNVGVNHVLVAKTGYRVDVNIKKYAK